MAGKQRAPRRSSGEMPGRSVRVADDVWEKARIRANYEGITMSRMVALICEGYGLGLIDLPKQQMIWAPKHRVDSEKSA